MDCPVYQWYICSQNLVTRKAKFVDRFQIFLVFKGVLKIKLHGKRFIRDSRIAPIWLSPTGHSPMAKVPECIGKSTMEARQLAKVQRMYWQKCDGLLPIGESPPHFHWLSWTNISTRGRCNGLSSQICWLQNPIFTLKTLIVTLRFRLWFRKLSFTWHQWSWNRDLESNAVH